MTEEVASEKISIRNSARSLKKYGSTSSHVSKAVNLVKHFVSSSDTLQGIALKYGVTTEQIRRTNRLWASDSLFLREYLLIPVPTDSPLSPSSEASSSIDRGSSCSEPALSRSTSTAVDTEEDSIDEFLGKIDSSIAITKSEVKKIQGNSEFLTDLDVGYERRKPAVSRMKQSANNNISSDPHAVVVSQTRKVRTSLQKMARQQDEIFEL